MADNELKNKRRLFHRREVWLPTRRGWLVLVGAALIVGLVLISSIQSFLAVTAPVPTGILVAEGWMDDYALQSVVKIFKGGQYQKVFVTGVPLEKGAPLAEYKTYAELGAAVILKVGLDTNTVQAVPAPDVRKDRTYASALALKDWLAAHGTNVSSLTVVSQGAHARRTRLLYEKAFGSDVEIGIISIPSREYDPKRWWTKSAGVREVVDETVAYLYARLIFHEPAN